MTVPTFYLAYLFAEGGFEDITAIAFVACSSIYNIFFGLGMGLVSGIFMSLTNPSVGATQFTGYMSLRNLAVSYSAFWQGLVVNSQGYATMLVIDAVVVIIPILTPSKTRHVSVVGNSGV